MAFDFQMPKLGLTMEEGTILEWLVESGTVVAEGDPVVRIETDKTETDVTISVSGRLSFASSVGQTFRCGDVIGYVADGSESESVQPLDGRVKSSPNARRLAAEAGVSLSTVVGTGPEGRILGIDVTDAASRQPQRAASATPVAALAASAPTASAPVRVAAAPTPTYAPVSGGGAVASAAARQLADLLGVDLNMVPIDAVEQRVTRDGVALYVRTRLAAATQPAAPAPVAASPLSQEPTQVVRLTGMRGTIAKRMQASLRDMAQLTLTMDVAMGAVAAHRAHQKSLGLFIGYTDYVMAATARALRDHPRVNAQVTADGIALLGEIHVGLAVALDEGLVVPVVRHTDRLGLSALSTETTRLASAARGGSLAVDDMAGGTFSVTALGMFGVDAFTPIVNPPNVAILGVGRLRDEVVLADGVAVNSSVMTLSLTWDHRAFDGAPAAQFCQTIAKYLATPAALE